MSRIRIAALLAALALVPAAAEAQSTITACYVPKTGSVYRIKAAGAPEACKNGHVEFSWTTSAGSYGPISTVSTSLTLAPYAQSIGVAACPAGSVPLSGGFQFPVPTFTPPAFTVLTNARTPDGTGWMVYAQSTDGNSSQDVIVHAYCATVTP